MDYTILFAGKTIDQIQDVAMNWDGRFRRIRDSYPQMTVENRKRANGILNEISRRNTPVVLALDAMFKAMVRRN